ncbi:MAG: hypothetical protein ACFFFK_05360 [Candidatus Thorarchaeota archaeon]
MTGQISDEFRYNGEVYTLVGINGVGLYTPGDFGMKTSMASTACWRGYQMFYDCNDGKMVLATMLANAIEAKPVNGIKPKEPEDSFMFKHVYEDIGLKTRFTGTILLGKDFIQEMYVHMGFQSPESYMTVIELELKNGDIIRETDLSTKMAKRRNAGMEKRSHPDSSDEDEIRDWIEERFSQDYESE